MCLHTSCLHIFLDPDWCRCRSRKALIGGSHAAFTPKITESQFRAGARASSKLVPALPQLRTGWFHTGESQPRSRREQRHDVTANVCLRLRFTSNPRSFKQQEQWWNFFWTSAEDQNPRRQVVSSTVHCDFVLASIVHFGDLKMPPFVGLPGITPPPAPCVKAVLVLAQL